LPIFKALLDGDFSVRGNAGGKILRAFDEVSR